MNKALRESQHHYHATAYGLAGELVRPLRHSIPTQAATVLVSGGGRGFQRVENFRLDGLVSFDAAFVEVGGSYDHDHRFHTTYALSVIEGLNIGDMVKADKVVSRLAIYSPRTDGEGRENSFDITGSHFENLRVGGHKLDVKLATHRFHDCQTYSALEDHYHDKSADEILCLHKLGQHNDLKAWEEEYSALRGLSDAADAWKTASKVRKKDKEAYWCSAANDLEKQVQEQFGKDSEIRAFGHLIVIPKFGVVRLAEVVIQKNHRALDMLRVHLCSASRADIQGGGTGGNGVPVPPGT